MEGTSFSSNILTSNTAQGGGAYLTSCTTTMFQCVFSDNQATNQGGGLYIIGGSTTSMSQCAFTNNQATYSGGGVFITGGTATSMTRCVFTDNYASSSGGGLCTSGGSVTANETGFESNYASTGGGWYFTGVSAALTAPYFVGNTGSFGNSDMYRASGSVTFESGCSSEEYFFGKDLLDCYTCYTWSSVYYPKDMRVEGCMPWTSYETAGTQDELESAIMFDRRVELTADISLTHAVAILGYENQATGKVLGYPIAHEANLTGVVIDGAGMYGLDGGSTYRCFFINNPGTEVTIMNLTIANGYTSIYAEVYTSSRGGAIYTGTSITLSMVSCVVLGGIASTGTFFTDESYGGGVFMGSNGKLHLRDSSFSSNRAYKGSGVYLSSGTVALIEDCVFDSNTYYAYRSSCSYSNYQSYGK